MPKPYSSFQSGSTRSRGEGGGEQGEATPFPLPWNEVEQGSESPTSTLVAFIELGPESLTQCPVRTSA